MAQDVEGFESCSSEVLLKLSESGLSFTLKREQELAMRHLFNGKDVMAVLPTGFGKSLIFQLFVMMFVMAPPVLHSLGEIYSTCDHLECTLFHLKKTKKLIDKRYAG